MPANPALGRWGETRAAEHLQGRGFTILHRNFRFRRNEIDLIARQGALVVFVEVKARAGDAFGHPLEAVTRRKRREIERVARAWMQRHGRPGDEYRFDAIAVRGRPDAAELVHVENAWRTDE